MTDPIIPRPIRLETPDGRWRILGPAHPIQTPCTKHKKAPGEPCFGVLGYVGRWDCCGHRCAANSKRMAKVAKQEFGT